MSVTLPPILKKLALKLYNISLLLSSSLYKSLLSSYAFIHSLSLAGGPNSSRCYKWKSYSLYRLYLKLDIGYYLGSLLNPVQLALYSSLFRRLQTVKMLSTFYLQHLELLRPLAKLREQIKVQEDKRDLYNELDDDREMSQSLRASFFKTGGNITNIRSVI